VERGTVTSAVRLRVKVFGDGASAAEMTAWARRPEIRGFTTNPTLMRQAGVGNYEAFARDVLRAIPDRPISFEVFSDEFDDMERQARQIAAWGENVYVKIPITNTDGRPSRALTHRLSHDGVKVNVTAVLSLGQVRDAVEALHGGAPSNISIFAGRIADTGRDPIPLMREALAIAKAAPSIEIIWASPREALNVYQADEAGCHIITVTGGILDKLALAGKDLDEFSLETVRMFRNDAVKAGYELSGDGQPA
jgi:transaldolase